MIINKSVIEGKWLEIKGELQKQWGRLTEDELETSKGDFKIISGLIQQKYGEAKEKSNAKLNEILARFKSTKDSIIGEVQEAIKKTN